MDVGSSEGNNETKPAALTARSFNVSPRSTAIPPSGSDGSITWTASEFIAHQKGKSWYLILGVGSVVLAVIIWLLTRDITTAIMVMVAAVMLAIVASKNPNEVEYILDGKGLYTKRKFIPYDQFKSFTINKQGAFSSIMLRPMKRFSLWTAAYYDPADEKKILDILTLHLPFEESKRDLIDDLMWKIRF